MHSVADTPQNVSQLAVGAGGDIGNNDENEKADIEANDNGNTDNDERQIEEDTLDVQAELLQGQPVSIVRHDPQPSSDSGIRSRTIHVIGLGLGLEDYIMYKLAI